MKLFGLFKNKEKNMFRITDPDKHWVEDNFRWLMKVFGYPYQEPEQIHISENFFSKTFQGDRVLIENIIKDLCTLLQIHEDKINFEVVTDIRDIYGMPYQMEGKPFETAVEIKEGRYKIYIANSLQKQSKRLVYSLVYEFIRIKLTDNKLPYDTGDDTDLFIYLAGIHFGFGVLLSQGLKDSGRIDDGLWETKWNYISEMPNEVMAYALAIYSKLIEQASPRWQDDLPMDLKHQFVKAIKYLNDNPSDLYHKQELEANELFRTSYDQYLDNKFEDAIKNLQKILLLTQDEVMIADVYNNLGYYNIRLRNYVESVSFLKSSIQIIPDYGYAHDNLGYAFIQLGNLEEAKDHLERAIKTDNNDNAYTYRNFALYYQAKGELNKAEEYFKKSFDNITNSVDLLEYHYAEFLMMNGDPERGLEFLMQAVNKGEPEAIERMNEIKKN